MPGTSTRPIACRATAANRCPLGAIVPPPPGAWQPERPGDPRDRAQVIAYHQARGEPLPAWAVAELPPPDPRDMRIAELEAAVLALAERITGRTAA